MNMILITVILTVLFGLGMYLAQLHIRHLVHLEKLKTPTWVIQSVNGYYFTGSGVPGMLWSSYIYKAETFATYEDASEVAYYAGGIVFEYKKAYELDQSARWVLVNRNNEYFADQDTTRILGETGFWSKDVREAHTFSSYEDASLIRGEDTVVKKIY